MTDTDPNGFPCPNLDETIDDDEDRVDRFDDLCEGNSLDENFSLAAVLTEGTSPPIGTVVRNDYPGDTKAEALGKAYSLRDRIRETGVGAEAIYVEPICHFGGETWHVVNIKVTESNEGE